MLVLIQEGIKKKKYKVRSYIPGSINPTGTEIKKIKEQANVIEDNKSKRKPSHSIIAAL